MKKILLSAVAIVSAGVLAAACSGGGDKTYDLNSGNYEINGDEVTADTCWADPAIHNVLVNFNLPVTIISTNQATFEIVPSGATADIGIPTITGTKTDNDLAATGTGTVHITSNCSLGFSGTVDGTMTGTDQFDLSLTLNLAVAGVLTTAGNPSDCSAFAGQDLPGVPIPVPAAISSNQQCSLTMVGTGYIP